MDSPDRDLLSTPMPIPAAGRSTRLRLDAVEIVLEHPRGGLLLLVHDGQEARRHDLGVGSGTGRLELRLLPPRGTVLVAPTHPLILAPGGRLRGYLAVPLVPTVTFCGPAGEAPLVEIDVPELGSGSDQDDGALYRCTATFLRRVMHAPRGTALVPVVLRNQGPLPVRPAAVPIELQARELRELRGRIVATPRRLHWRAGGVTTAVRPFPPSRGDRGVPGTSRPARQGAAAPAPANAAQPLPRAAMRATPTIGAAACPRCMLHAMRPSTGPTGKNGSARAPSL